MENAKIIAKRYGYFYTSKTCVDKYHDESTNVHGVSHIYTLTL
ncbi:hypothetical protein Q7O_002207 [Pectobacterium carotovorum subsp. carotovorum PCCS1]|nr:hypothetical protein [Pectobacterium carotovorum subsp. carotovorum PCCS1]